jgi:hypothetical protein
MYASSADHVVLIYCFIGCKMYVAADRGVYLSIAATCLHGIYLFDNLDSSWNGRDAEWKCRCLLNSRGVQL